MQDFKDLEQQAMAIRQKYNQLNAKLGHNAWGPREYLMGLVGDIGDLSKLVMAAENFRTVKGGGDALDGLKHELWDCLWSLFVIAEHYKIDLGQAFSGTMTELHERIAGGRE